MYHIVRDGCFVLPGQLSVTHGRKLAFRKDIETGSARLETDLRGDIPSHRVSFCGRRAVVT